MIHIIEQSPATVKCSCILELTFSSPGEARRVAEALEPDNEGYVSTVQKGPRLFVKARARTIPALLHTLDDYLACLQVACGLGQTDTQSGPPDEK